MIKPVNLCEDIMIHKVLNEVCPDVHLDLSVIISTFSIERLNDINEILDHLNKQFKNSFELIIIVDCDSRYYRELSNSLHRRHLRFKACVIFNPINNGLSYSRNIGVTNAKGHFVAFLDDDALPEPQWTKEVIDAFDEGVGAVTGDVFPLWESPEMSWFPKELFWMISCSYTLCPKEKKTFDRGFGVNMAFRRDSVLRSGMFDERLGINKSRWVGGEDTAMFIKIKESGEKIIFNPLARVHHKIPARRVYLKSLIKRAYSGGVSIAILSSVNEYRLLNSTESTYSKDLFYRFYPSSVRSCVRDLSIMPIKRMFYVSLCSTLVVLGYICQSLFLTANNSKEEVQRQLDRLLFPKVSED